MMSRVARYARLPPISTVNTIQTRTGASPQDRRLARAVTGRGTAGSKSDIPSFVKSIPQSNILFGTTVRMKVSVLYQCINDLPRDRAGHRTTTAAAVFDHHGDCV